MLSYKLTTAFNILEYHSHMLKINAFLKLIVTTMPKVIQDSPGSYN